MRLAVFAIALVVRLAAIEVTGAERIDFGDGADYVATAQSLCAQHVYPVRGNLPFFRAPGLPFFIAGVTACHPRSVRAIKYGLAVADALTCVLIASLLGFRGGRIAGLLAALDPFFIAGVTDVRSEPLYMFLLSAAIWLLLRNHSAGAGVAAALAALTRPVGLVAVVLFALYRPRRAGIVLVAAALTLAPWTIRNYVRFHELIVVNDAGGYNLWRGVNPELRRIAEIKDRDEFHRASFNFETSVPPRGDFTRLAIEEMKAHPREVALFTLKKAWLYWRPWLNPQEYPLWMVIASGIANALLYALAALQLRTTNYALPMFFVVMWLAHIPFQVVMRFRIPNTDPLLIALAASTLDRARAGADSRSRSGGAAPA